jgi:hypothetical protein
MLSLLAKDNVWESSSNGKELGNRQFYVLKGVTVQHTHNVVGWRSEGRGGHSLIDRREHGRWQ